MKLCATVDGLSLEILCALDRVEGILWGVATPDEGLGTAESIGEYGADMAATVKDPRTGIWIVQLPTLEAQTCCWWWCCYYSCKPLLRSLSLAWSRDPAESRRCSKQFSLGEWQGRIDAVHPIVSPSGAQE